MGADRARRPRVALTAARAADLGVSARLDGRRVPVLGQRPTAPAHHAIVGVRDDAALSARAARALHEQSVAEQMKEAPNTLFFDMGVHSSGYFNFLGPEQQLELMNSVEAATREKLQDTPHFLRAMEALTPRHSDRVSASAKTSAKTSESNSDHGR